MNSSLNPTPEYDALVRSHSAPPTYLPELGAFSHIRLNDDDRLEPDPALLKRFSSVRIIYRVHAAIVLYVDNKNILKVLSPLIDVEEIAGIMKLASTVVPVPKVHDYGYSGGCSYILMDFVSGFNLLSSMRMNGIHISREPLILAQVEEVVKRLASIGLSHNDLYARNIIVDKNCLFVGVIDWDVAGPWTTSKEYARRLHFGTHEPAAHDWDFIFRRYCPDVIELDTITEDPDYNRNSIQGRRPWSIFWYWRLHRGSYMAIGPAEWSSSFNIRWWRQTDGYR